MLKNVIALLFLTVVTSWHHSTVLDMSWWICYTVYNLQIAANQTLRMYFTSWAGSVFWLSVKSFTHDSFHASLAQGHFEMEKQTCHIWTCSGLSTEPEPFWVLVFALVISISVIHLIHCTKLQIQDTQHHLAVSTAFGHLQRHQPTPL